VFFSQVPFHDSNAMSLFLLQGHFWNGGKKISLDEEISLPWLESSGFRGQARFRV
jgi:hypothetical protein